MNLIIDIGNTKTKAYFYQLELLKHTSTSDKNEEDFVSEILHKNKSFDKAIVSSVKGYPDSLIKFLDQKISKVFYFDHRLPTPIQNLYESKETLGYDRLAACVGASQKYPGSNLLVVDAGTAITFDFVDSKRQYRGGCISPGLNMRFMALHHFTRKLPLLEQDDEFQTIGRNTNQAITGGVQNGILFEVDGYISELKQQYPDLKVVLTGGDAHFIQKNIRHKSELDQEILAFGLNLILEYNTLESANNE